MTVPPPRLDFPPELPITGRREEIARALAENRVVIVAGETGSGKTTQLPKICLELGRKSIAHTQPRRIAARAVAERVAAELGEEVGDTVGYRVRFTDRAGADTRVTLMTDGILLNEMHRDRALSRYDTIIIDEAHERSLNVDFLLGYLKTLLARRDDLKVIVTSATIDPASFARHFADPAGRPAPVIEVSGRGFPVEVRYRPLVAEDGPDEGGEPREDRDTITAIGDALDELAREDPGDVLVFLSGENEIRDAEEAVRARSPESTEVLPLYGRLSAADQHRVFSARPAGVRRRVVLATNVAETSLTVPGIRYVIDAGTARISRYSTRAKVQRLPIEPVSQASAKQRSGRSGRTSPGIAIRLYSEEDYERRPEFTDPEILRTNLAAVLLQMAALDLGPMEDFPFLTPPDSRGVKDGLDLLRELGALELKAKPISGLRRDASADARPGRRYDEHRDASADARPGRRNDEHRGTPDADPGPRLTRIGRGLARLPIDPRFARMILESRRHDVAREVLAIVAGLSIQDPRERPLEKRAQADQQHARFTDPSSDFLTLLNLWRHLEERRGALGSSAFRRMCRAEYLNHLRVREWQDVYRQLKRLVRGLDITVHDRAPLGEPDGDAIHRSLLAGLLSHLGIRDERRRDYAGARGTRFVLFPGSALAKKRPRAVMSAELVETSRLFARTNAAVDPAWAEALAGDLCTRSHGEPHWEKRQGQAVAYERVTLFGVPLVERRRVQYRRIDPEHARELFVQHALVEGERPGRDGGLYGFEGENAALRERLGEVEERTRRRDILSDDEAVFAFYDRRVPADVASVRDFERWWRRERRESPRLLTMTEADLLPEDAPDLDEAEYPSSWSQGEQRLDLAYRFAPGEEDDGVSVAVPLPLLAGLESGGFDWQVPGMRAELVTAMIRVLPKSIRRHVVPAADWAARLVGALPAPDPAAPEPFPAVLAATIARLAQVPVAAEDFDLSRLPGHLRPTFRVLDEAGEPIATGKDLQALQSGLGERARASVASATSSSPHALEREGIERWDLESIPETVDTPSAGGVVRGYPALVDEGGTVALRVFATRDEQERAHPAGVRRLLLSAVPSPASYVREHLTQGEKLTLAASPYASTAALFDDCLLACADAALREEAADGMLRDRAAFERTAERLSAGLVDRLFRAVALVARTLAALRSAERALERGTDITLLPALTDVREQLGALVHPGFVSATGLARLPRLPAYLAGAEHRLAKLPENPGRDRTWMLEVQKAVDAYRDAGGVIPPAAGAPERLGHARWMLEEFRLSLFAQHLGTAEPVSLKRIRRALTP